MIQRATKNKNIQILYSKTRLNEFHTQSARISRKNQGTQLIRITLRIRHTDALCLIITAFWLVLMSGCTAILPVSGSPEVRATSSWMIAPVLVRLIEEAHTIPAEKDVVAPMLSVTCDTKLR